MTGKVSHFRLGIFVLIALVILVALIVSVGGGKFLRPRVTVETYFDESVQGLDVGSKVRYRGVEIGEVKRISFTYTEYELNKPPADRKQYVLVEMAVYPDMLGMVGGGRQFVDQLVQDGLRIRMVPIGITGILYLELDFTRKSDILPISWTPRNLYIPSTRSTVVNLVNAVEGFMAKIATVDLGALAGKLDRLLDTLKDKADGLDTERLSRDAAVALARLQRILGDVQQMTGRDEWKNMPVDLATTVQRLRQIAEGPELGRILAALDSSSQRLDRTLAGREEDIAELIANLRAISADLKDVSERLKRDPAGTLLAKPPRHTNAYGSP